MQFIDKRNKENESEGNSIVNEFIKAQWDNDSQRYINLDYSEFGESKSRIVALTRKEQSDFCCYCMRRITDQNITLEHVIPNKIRSKENYQEEVEKYQIFEILLDNVSVWEDQDFQKEQSTPPFPHFIAYQNLVASCNGVLIDKNGAKLERHQCCNNRRENDFVIPFFFMSDIAQRISYSKEGDIIFEDEFKDTIKSLNLNDGTLKLLRKAWNLLGENISENEIEAGKDDFDKRFEILDEADIDQMIKNTLLSDIYWTLFCEYKWFYSYYHAN